MQKIVSKKHQLNLNAAELIDRELPILRSVYHSENELDFDIADWLDYYINHEGDGVSVYHMKREVGEEVVDQLTRYYHFMLHGLQVLFSKSDAEILKYYPCEMIEKHGRVFLEYAKSEFFKPGALRGTIGGRFDACLNPDTGKLEGVYELNGDTPVMLFESVNLENLFSTQISGSAENQFNDWWPNQMQNFQHLRDKNIGIVCDVNYIEDATTCETIAQMFDEVGANTFFSDLRHLVYDPSNLSVPFYIEGSANVPDVIFILHPWEEMVMYSPEIIANYRFWGPHLKFLEPAWRWFMSHKGFMVFLTEWLKDPKIKELYGDVRHLPTYFTPDSFDGTYVAKPVHGRLSQNIKVFVGGEVKHETGGQYNGIPEVFQEYRPPYKLGDGRNFIVGGWISGGNTINDTKVATLCFREFDGAVLDLQNERFISHVVDDEFDSQ